MATMMKIKALLAKILNWIKAPVSEGVITSRSRFLVRLDNVDLKQSNNGIASGAVYPGFMVEDKNGYWAMRLESVINSTGDVGFKVYSRQYDGDTYRGQFALGLNVTKAGVATWSMNPVPIVTKLVPLGSWSINANSGLNFNITPYVKNACPVGYSPAGIIGYSTNHGSVVMKSARLVNSDYSFECQNLSSANLTITPEVWILYVQSGMYKEVW